MGDRFPPASGWKILSVAEKPSVAKELAAIIAGIPSADPLRRQSLSPYNPVYEISDCRFRDQPAYMRVTSVTGHLMELDFTTAARSWATTAPLDLFSATISREVRKDGLDIERNLQSEAKRANTLVLWLDCDLEGENIAYEVISVCYKANPSLDIYRARFSALIPRDILRTLRVPDRPNPHMNDAVEARQEIDLRIGAAFTRFQTLRLQRRFEGLANSTVISYGPCQFPTLGFVVERDLDIERFHPEKFWMLVLTSDFIHPDDNEKKLQVTFRWDRHRVYDELTAILLYEACIEPPLIENHDETKLEMGEIYATVIRCQDRPTVKKRPVPLNTIDFQIAASRLLRLASDRAMSIAEALYQRGILSYPRTETNFFKEGFELNTLVTEHMTHPTWGNFARDLIENGRFEWPRHGGKDDQAHPPIHPTKSVPLDSFTNPDEKAVYELVSRHFLACCAQDARGSQTNISVAIPAEGGEIFHTSGLMVLERNWLDVYSKYESWSGHKVPTLRVGDRFVPKSLTLDQGETTPPEPLSESDLISTMDKNGIGTDATIATHIATIQSREYAVKDARNRFTATALGRALVEGYNTMGYQLNKPQLRAQIEADCQRVAKGELRKDEVVARCLATMRQCFLDCVTKAAHLDAAVEKHFSALGTGDQQRYDILDPNLSTCGVCHEGMELRQEKQAGGGAGGGLGKDPRRFLYCKHCQRAHIVPPRGELLQHEVSCPLCGFQVVTVRNRETNKDHTICPQCYGDPPPPPVGIEGGQDFRCFSCAAENCELAGRIGGADVDITRCVLPNCSGTMRLRKTAKKAMIACTSTGCRGVWWVPSFVRSLTPLPDEPCESCSASGTSVIKLSMRVHVSKAPPGVDPERKVCLCCDPLWKDIGIDPLPVKQAPMSVVSRNGRLVLERDGTPYGHGTPGSLGANTPQTTTTPVASNPYDAALAGRRTAPPSGGSGGGIAYHGGGTSYGGGGGGGGSGNTPGGGGNLPQCGCGQPCNQFTVKNGGPNNGRVFYKCPTRDGGCNYFQWADEPPRVFVAGGRGGAGRGATGGRGGRGGRSTGRGGYGN